MSLSPGRYELLISERVRLLLRDLPPTLTALDEKVDPAEVADRVSRFVRDEVAHLIQDLPDADRADASIQVTNVIRDALTTAFPSSEIDRLASSRLLVDVAEQNPDGTPASTAAPLVPLSDSTLLTNAPGEPGLWSQLRSEIASSDSIDVVMAFVRKSGLAPLIQELRRHCERGRRLRVLTTTYTGSTQREALEDLVALGAEVRVSYDTSTTRLHAKGWLFRRMSGFSTGYVGSSNLTHSAQATGLEWNVRLSAVQNNDALMKLAAVFESYWSNGEFVPFEADRFDVEVARATGSSRGLSLVLSPIEVRPLPFQERLLELIAVSRDQGRHENLLVAATGTGKTVMAAIDYAGLRRQLDRSRLLFVAHHGELLEQALATFRQVIRDPSFGELWVGGRRPSEFQHVFASVQSLDARGIGAIDPRAFDVLVIDEFHHAAASSYQRLLDHLQPVELLGLTATPERSDGLPILHWFGNRIAAELRLWDAIDQQLLSPFLYFGIHDGVDLRQIPWRRGAGYDPHALTDALTGSDVWARLVIQELDARVDIGSMRALGFCVSVAHAQFMADQFVRHGIAAVAISGETGPEARLGHLRDLTEGRIRIIFSVDVFNEGVDAPDVDTLLLLRPTESPVLFLQQLGRGLRRSAAKPYCVVLDFIGQHRKEFRFDRKLRALLGGTRKDLEASVTGGFPYLPAGSSMQLDPVAAEIVLRSLRDALPSRWPAKVEELRSVRRSIGDVSLGRFLAESGLELEDVYDGSHSWSDLKHSADVALAPDGPHEAALRRAVGRLLHVDDRERMEVYARVLGGQALPNLTELTVRDRRLIHMLTAQVGDQVFTRQDSVEDSLALLWDHPNIRHELLELLEPLAERVSHIQPALKDRPEIPLRVHASYTRLEILVAMGLAARAKVAAWQSGVFEAKPINSELLAFTIDKTSKSFSPTTRYRDYAISSTLIHWESQASTRADGPTGRRYRNHEAENRRIYLFAREHATSRAFWFLGQATYRGHVSERPMQVTWELAYPLSGDLLAALAAAA